MIKCLDSQKIIEKYPTEIHDAVTRVVYSDWILQDSENNGFGALEVLLDDGKNKRTVQLNRPYYGLHVPPGIWASEQGFSSGSICLVLASHKYNEADYVRSYEDFLKIK